METPCQPENFNDTLCKKKELFKQAQSPTTAPSNGTDLRKTADHMDRTSLTQNIRKAANVSVQNTIIISSYSKI